MTDHHDPKTVEIARELVAKIKAAWDSEDASEYARLLGIADACVNRPLRRELARQLAEMPLT